MQRNARTAFNQLKKSQIHVIDHGSRDANDGAHFLLGCEVTGDDRLPAGDYYLDDFGVRTLVSDILADNGLFAEWVNPAIIGVYDA